MPDSSSPDAVLVVGGGAAGVAASLGLAEAGVKVLLVERENDLGGVVAGLERTFPTPKCSMTVTRLDGVRGGGWDREKEAVATGFASHHWSSCLYCCTLPLVADCLGHPNIEVLTGTEIQEVTGQAPDFSVSLTGDQARSIQVRAIVLAPGFSTDDPACHQLYGLGVVPNVVTSLEFEKASASFGPDQGQIKRPSDGRQAASVAWLQCVGSRDVNACDNGYCSSVCCEYAVKEASITKQRAQTEGREIDCAVYYMDLRTMDKGCERSLNWAADDLGVRFVRSRVSDVSPAEGDRVKVGYADEDGRLVEEVFDLVVLSVGLHPGQGIADLAAKVGVDLDADGFVQTGRTNAVATSRDGVYVCGTAAEPKDISASVIDGLAAAGSARLDVAPEGRLNVPAPPDASAVSSDAPPRIAVFVEDFEGVLDAEDLVGYSQGLPDVVAAERIEPGGYRGEWPRLAELVEQSDINRVVLAGGRPKITEPLLRRAMAAVGLDRRLTEIAPIRDQAAGVFGSSPDKAMDRARDLIRMAVARAGLNRPDEPIVIDVNPRCLVIGGGAAGLQAALDVAAMGSPVTLLEKSDRLGGVALDLRRTWRGQDIGPLVSDLVARVEATGDIEVVLGARVKRAAGFSGRFLTTYVVDGQECSVDHGAVIVATGAGEVKPTEYLYGDDDRVMTALELDRRLDAGPDQVQDLKQVVFIQCVGSREPDRPYCSKICCTHSVASALHIKEMNPQAQVFILYRDIRTYGQRERLYQEAREKGVRFVRFDLGAKPSLAKAGDDLELTVRDHVLGRDLLLNPDLVCLAAAVKPSPSPEIQMAYNVGVNPDGFLQEAHAKYKPADLGAPGVFVAGTAQYPKFVEDSLAQARAAATRAMSILARPAMAIDGVVAQVDVNKCAVCCTCVRTCPFGIPYIGSGGGAVIDPARCYGCGICVSECPGKAIELTAFTDGQIEAQVTTVVAGI